MDMYECMTMVNLEEARPVWYNSNDEVEDIVHIFIVAHVIFPRIVSGDIVAHIILQTSNSLNLESIMKRGNKC